jgi:O-antigen/teichoic acid export membrane protein
VAYNDLFVWIMLSAAILYLSSVIGSAITAARSFRSQAALAAVATAAVLLASLLLVETHGLNGAAMAMCFGFALKLLGEVGILFTLLRN